MKHCKISDQSDKQSDDIFLKGQLISECLFDDLNFPKKQRKIWQISAQETKKLSNLQSKGTLL